MANEHLDNGLINKLDKEMLNAILEDSRLVISHCKNKDFTQAKELLANKFINLELQDDSGCTAFHYACIHEDKEMLDLLLNKYIFPHLMEEYTYHDPEHFIGLQDKNDNKTILHYISEKNLIEFYNKLELHFPHKIHNTINHLTKNGHSPLQLACEKGHLEILEKILKIPGININQTDKHGNTALHIACWNNNLNIVKQLLLHPQINVNLRNHAGDTPLHQICRSRCLGIGLIAKELLNMASLNINIRNNQHLLPVDLSEEHNQYEITALLKQYKESQGSEP